jgi:hypothetical protein
MQAGQALYPEPLRTEILDFVFLENSSADSQCSYGHFILVLSPFLATAKRQDANDHEYSETLRYLIPPCNFMVLFTGHNF